MVNVDAICVALPEIVRWGPALYCGTPDFSSTVLCDSLMCYRRSAAQLQRIRDHDSEAVNAVLSVLDKNVIAVLGPSVCLCWDSLTSRILVARSREHVALVKALQLLSPGSVARPRLQFYIFGFICWLRSIVAHMLNYMSDMWRRKQFDY